MERAGNETPAIHFCRAYRMTVWRFQSASKSPHCAQWTQNHRVCISFIIQCTETEYNIHTLLFQMNNCVLNRYKYGYEQKAHYLFIPLLLFFRKRARTVQKAVSTGTGILWVLGKEQSDMKLMGQRQTLFINMNVWHSVMHKQCSFLHPQ